MFQTTCGSLTSRTQRSKAADLFKDLGSLIKLGRTCQRDEIEGIISSDFAF